jgi:AcrR family transcriptional regulator
LTRISQAPEHARPIHVPQRSNGKLRVAAILEAAAAVIDEKGYEGATMAEIAVRSSTKIGSLYRFFPNKESLADTILISAREELDATFDRFDGKVVGMSIQDLADGLLKLIFEFFSRSGFRKLLDSGPEWSAKREGFRLAIQHRISHALRLHSPKLPKKMAQDMALVILLNGKIVATEQKLFDSVSDITNEFRDLTRFYLQNRLGTSGAER